MVRPEWIVDSLKAGRLISMEDYLLERLRGGPGQRTIHAFKDITAQPLAADAIYPAARQRQCPDQATVRPSDQPVAVHGEHIGMDSAEQRVEVEDGGLAGRDAGIGEQEGGSCLAETTEWGEGNRAERNGDQPGGGMDSEEDFSFVVAAPKRSRSSIQASAALPEMEAPALPVSEGTTDPALHSRGGLPAPAGERDRPVNVARNGPGRASFDPEDMRVAQAAAAAARGRCDMLKVQRDPVVCLLLETSAEIPFGSKERACSGAMALTICECGLSLGFGSYPEVSTL